ncbi:EndoU domain-containing protein [Amycolatopsis magusensis]|uniref:EndoU domain-containing protein n=1 Tax=Amycolatopsis magusensis TaxID=882444 RepID=UPI00379727C0
MGGGHAAGTGRRATTEFPPEWGGRRILRLVTDVANDPDEPPRRLPNGRWRASGVRDGVSIVVLVQPDGRVVTGFPTAGPGVVRNPDTAADPANPTVADLTESRVSFFAERLLVQLANRLPIEALTHYHEIYLAGEWVELVDVLAAHLFTERTPLSVDEHSDLERLLHVYDRPPAGFHFLNDRQHILAALQPG